MIRTPAFRRFADSPIRRYAGDAVHPSGSGRGTPPAARMPVRDGLADANPEPGHAHIS
jgi:hypothetical protein